MWPLTPLRFTSATRAIALVLLALVVATIVWSPMLWNWPLTADLDGRYFLHQWEAGKAAIRNYGEFPLWNPFDCRGVAMWDHPESTTGSPLLLLSTWFSAAHTLWIWNIAHCAAGFLSMWLLVRREVGMARVPALLSSALWAAAAGHLGQYAGGHSSLVDFWLAPLLVYLWRRAERETAAAVKLGLVIAFMIYEGATYPLPFIVVVVALETLTRIFRLRRVPSILRAGVVTGVVAIGASAARLFPVAVQLVSKTRGHMMPDVDTLARPLTLRFMYLWRDGHWWHRAPLQQYVWAEYFAYIGWAGLALALIGLFVSLRERRWLVALATFTALLMLGHFARWAPWDVLNRNVLPYRSMRVPSRFRLVFELFVAAWIGLAVQRIPELVARVARGNRRLVHASFFVAFAAAGVALVDPAALGMSVIGSTIRGAPALVVERSPDFYYGGRYLAEWLDQPRQNRSWLGCRSYEWPANMEAPVWMGDVPQARAKPANADVVKVSNVHRTQNTFTFDVEATAPGRVLLNSAHGIGWRSSVGTVVDDRTLLAVDVPAGTHHVRVHYWPRLMTEGLVLTSVTLLGVTAFFVLSGLRSRRARRRYP